MLSPSHKVLFEHVLTGAFSLLWPAYKPNPVSGEVYGEQRGAKSPRDNSKDAYH